MHFNPLPSCEGRQNNCKYNRTTIYFNPLPSCEGRRNWAGGNGKWISISIHSPHARGDAGWLVNPCFDSKISIHSPHARGDPGAVFQLRRLDDFNPLPSCEGRPRRLPETRCLPDFNPLPSCEGRPEYSPIENYDRTDFNPLPSCEGRPEYSTSSSAVSISIHSPHARGDLSYKR